MLGISNNFGELKPFNTLKPISPLIKTYIVPITLHRKTATSFYYCDINDHITTNIIQCKFNSDFQIESSEIIQEFMGQYENYQFGDDHTLMLNREGDLIYYDNISKDTFFIEKQHPSPFHPTQIHSIDSFFLTCGGDVTVKNQQHQKIIKIWKSNTQQELQMKTRIVTGHTNPIQNSIILGRNKIITLSTDLTIRCINLSTFQTQAILPTSVCYYSGCQNDWNSVLLGGISNFLGIYDFRTHKKTNSIQLSGIISQISTINKVNNYSCLLSNTNQIRLLDLRNNKSLILGQYDGQRICSMTALSSNTILIGNRSNTIQLWSCQ